MSQIHGRVFDSSIYGWIADVVSGMDISPTYTYIDGSINERDVSIAWLDAYRLIQDASIAINTADVNKAYVDASLYQRDTSIAWNTSMNLTQDTSIAWLDANKLEASDIAGLISKTYVDGSLALRDTSIAWLDMNKLEVSDLSSYSTISYTDGSLNERDTSIGWLNSNKIGAVTTTGQGYSLVQTSGPPITVLKGLNTGDNIKITSENFALVIDSSGLASNSYVDGSLALRDTSIAWLNANKADTGDIPTDFYSQAYVDGSLSERDTSIEWLRNNGIFEASLGDTIYWDAGYLEASTGTTINTLNDIGDVSVSGAEVNQVLTWKGTYWEPADVSGGLGGDASIMGLTDVSLSNLANNNVLAYNSSNGYWENKYTTIDASDYFQYKIALNSPSTGAAGNAGQWCYDSSYLYICTSTNMWGRILLTFGY